MAHSYKQLIVWQKSKQLAIDICIVARRFPKNELYGLTSQLRRAAVSVSCNIAEGQGRLTKGEFAHSLGIARGSLLEVQTLLAIAMDLGYLDAAQGEKLDSESAQVLRAINGLLESIKPRTQAAGA